MYLSASIWLRIFLTLLMFNNVNLYNTSTGIQNYKKFYYDLLGTEDGTTFIVSSLWRGVEIGQLSDQNQCYNDIRYYQQEVKNKEEWALKMYDSSTHLQSGFLEGNVIDYGNTDECIKIENVRNDVNDPYIRGSMCYIIFITGNKSDNMVLERYMITFSACVPSSCSRSEVDVILSYGIRFHAYYYISECVNEETFSPPYDSKAFYIVAFFLVLLIVILLSTIYDVFKTECCNSRIEEDSDKATLIKPKKEESRFEGVLTSFSLYRNGKALLQEDTKEESIKTLHGLRFFAACGVLCVHRHLLDPQPFTNMFMIDEEMRRWYRMIQFNAYLWVDVFFLMSGLLLSYNFLMRSENKRRLNVWKFYLHRYIRLTPTLAAVILLNLLSDHMCSGPHCSYLTRLFKHRCETNWWATLIYINNIYDQFHMCVIQAWYLAADMQLYWCSPILLYTLIRWRRLIFIELLLLFTATTSWVFFISYKLGLLATFIGTNQFFEDDSKYVYNQFFARAGPWLIGFALGIKLQQHNEEPIKLSKLSVLLGWIIAPIFCLVPMFGITPFVQENYERNRPFDSLFKALHRDVWALGFAWIVYACYTGHGGWVNKFLSSYIFHPISRLTYSFYLIHIFGQFLQFQDAYVPRHYNDLTQLSLLSGDVVIGMALAVILHLSVEAPSLNLEKALCNRKAIKEQEESKRRIVKEA